MYYPACLFVVQSLGPRFSGISAQRAACSLPSCVLGEFLLEPGILTPCLLKFIINSTTMFGWFNNVFIKAHQ